MNAEKDELQNSVAVMVAKQYFERVKDYLLADQQISWETLQHIISSAEDPILDTKIGSSGENLVESTESKKVAVLDATETTGNSNARRGFLVVLFKDVKRPIDEISPMARQNMAWALKITHSLQYEKSLFSTEEAINRIMDTLPIAEIPLVGNDQALRVDVYPKSYIEDACLCLQRACHQKLPNSKGESPNNPFEGPIEMILSASKCSHRLAVIISETLDTSSVNVCWGWMDRRVDEGIMSVRVNKFASDEILLIPPVNDDGQDPEGVTSEVPVSRAFYKLDQVWREMLVPNEQSTLSLIEQLKASAIDFGSAPGGWTQVLASQAKGVKAICSVDRGALGERVLKLPQVKYIKSLLEDGLDKLKPYGPFGILVCDASQLWSELLELFVKAFTGESTNSSMPAFTLPCIFVITMKLPFQTPMSIQRHVDLIRERTPQFLSNMAKVMYPDAAVVKTRSSVVHLMANSPSERTLLIVFEKAPPEATII